jgi:hypothetical protein
MSTGCTIAWGSSSRKKGARGSPNGNESDGEVVVALFTTGGGKLKCSRPAVTSATRLGGGAPRS